MVRVLNPLIYDKQYRNLVKLLILDFAQERTFRKIQNYDLNPLLSEREKAII